jgi:hypothetical protein
MGNQQGAGAGGGASVAGVAARASSSSGADAEAVAALRAKGMSLMNKSVQRKLIGAGGAGNSIYNMRVILRGDKESGKSALLRRLEGGEFIDQYSPTPEIQTAHINWNYKGQHTPATHAQTSALPESYSLPPQYLHAQAEHVACRKGFDV